MNELGPRARALIDRVGALDGPPAGTRERVRAGLGAALGAGALAGSGTAFGAAAGKSAAAATGLWGITGKTGATIVLWVLAGGAAGVAVTGPLAYFAGGGSSSAVSPRATDPAELRQAPPGVEAPKVTLSPPNLEPGTESRVEEGAKELPAQERTPRAPGAKAVSPREELTMAREEPPPPAAPSDVSSGIAASAMATELALLKTAQRELNAGNAERSLALLDEHARRYPAGALRLERLGARVFALCQLGRVDAARTTASEFLTIASDSPLVPRVLSSCAGTKSR